MSDYDEQEYQYDEEGQEDEEEDVSTRVELEYYDIEDLLRNGKQDKAIQDLEQLYLVCEDNNLKHYKIKILNQLLSIYSKNSSIGKISSTLSKISSLNKQEKFTENAVKSILTIVRGANYKQLKNEVTSFIEEFDREIKLKLYLFLLERSLDEQDKVESRVVLEKVERLMQECESISASTQLEYFSLEIRHCQMNGLDISDKVHEVELRLPKLQTEAYMSEGNISMLKLIIAENMFQTGNYESSASNIFDSFLEKTKYGTSVQLKQILKVNALICMLIQEPEHRKKESINALFHQSSIPFKNEPDIQNLLTLIGAYERHDISEFNRIYEEVNFKPESKKYLAIQQHLLFKMKKEKLFEMVKSYQTIRFTYIGRRLSLSEQEVERIVFELIIDGQIHGRMNDADPKNKFLDILPTRNRFLEIQAENLNQLGNRFL